MVFLPPSGGVSRLSLTRSSPDIPSRRLCGCQGTVLNLAIKKSPHNNLNLTILSGMALVRVRYVTIRKLKTCSGSFGSRAGTLSKYVIFNCWDGLPQKSSRVNVNLSGRGPSILLRKTVLSLIAIQLFNATATMLNCISQICWLNVALISCLAIKAPLGLSLLRFASQTRTSENTPLSAACKKRQEKLWQKERAG